MNMEVDPLPPRSEHGSGPPGSEHGSGPSQEVNTEVNPPPPPPELDAEEVVEEDQLRSTAGQAGGMP